MILLWEFCIIYCIIVTLVLCFSFSFGVLDGSKTLIILDCLLNVPSVDSIHSLCIIHVEFKRERQAINTVNK